MTLTLLFGWIGHCPSTSLGPEWSYKQVFILFYKVKSDAPLFGLSQVRGHVSECEQLLVQFLKITTLPVGKLVGILGPD